MIPYRAKWRLLRGAYNMFGIAPNSVSAPFLEQPTYGTHPLLRALMCSLLLWPLVTSCTWRSVEPVVKIGLLAPFEGLHRRTGYEALAAMRLALEYYERTHGTNSKSVHQTIIPLALHLDFDDSDDFAQARRTVAKLLADHHVRAIIGPYDPRLEVFIANEYNHAALTWLLPLRLDIADVDPLAMFGLTGNRHTMIAALAAQVAEQAAALGATELVVAGWEGQWQEDELLDVLATTTLALPYTLLAEGTVLLDDNIPTAGVTTIPTSAMLWVGAPEKAVAYLESDAMNSYGWQSIWFGPLGGDPILPERLFRNRMMRGKLLEQVKNNVYWVTWLDANRTAEGQALSPMANLTYRATEAALAAIDPSYSFAPAQWQIGVFQLQPDGSSRQLQRER